MKGEGTKGDSDHAVVHKANELQRVTMKAGQTSTLS